MADPVTGNNKAYACAIGGAICIVFMFFWQSFLPTHPIDASTAAAFQTLFTTLAVFLTPHGGN